MVTLHIALLGSFHVSINNQPVPFRTDAERALLAYLAAHQGTPQRRDTLATLLSPDRNDSDALTYLRNRLTRLRSAIHDDQAAPSWLNIDRKAIALRTGDDIVIDITQFEAHLAAVERHAHRQLAACPTCLAQLTAAVELVRGEFLAGLNFPSDTWEAWIVAEREHLRQRALQAMSLLRDARVEQGDWSGVLAIAQRQLALEPWLEAAHRAAMLAHHQLGERTAALAQYEQCAALLWEELGVEPEAETAALQQRLWADEVEKISTTSIPDNLPHQLGRFVGRVGEQERLLQRLADPDVRLLTIVGTGGVGKTRLALEVGQAIKANFPDGVWFVALDGMMGDAEQIKIAIGESAGLGQGEQLLTGAQVLTLLRNKAILLILDNCESVLDDLGFLGGWLGRAPGVVVLATSREPLNLQAESVFVLAGLPVGEITLKGGDGGEAEALFVEWARRADAAFICSSENLPQVRQICQLVDGLPLGIALAAGWVRRRSLTQIIASIEQSLDFLSTQLRDVDPRHRSMRAVFETSWQMLDGEEQAILAALAIFPANFTAEAAAQVAGAQLFDLDAFCEKSLLQQQQGLERYSLHSLVRQFAGEKSRARTAEIEEAFGDYYYHFAHSHRTNYTALQPEWHNFAAALTKAHAAGAWQRLLDFVAVLDEPWFRQIRFTEMRAGLALALDAAMRLADEAAHTRILLRLGEVEIEQNEYDAAEAHLNAAYDHFLRLESGTGIAHANYLLGRIQHERAQNEEALQRFAESKRIFEQEADWLGVAKSLNLMALCHMKQDPDFPTAHAYLTESVAIQKDLAPSATYVEALRYLGRIHGIFGDESAAERCLVDATDISYTLHDMGEYAAVLFDRIVLCRRRNQLDTALQFGAECLEHVQQLGSLRWVALVKMQLAIVHQCKEEHEAALPLLLEGLEIFHELDDRYEQAYSYYYLHKAYTAIGATEQSVRAGQEALWLNATLQDPQLQSALAA